MARPTAHVRTTLAPGEKVCLVGSLPAGADLERATINIAWACPPCGRRRLKSVLVLEANGVGIQIACPFCDPDELAGRGVQVQPPVRWRQRLIRFCPQPGRRSE